MNTHTEEQAPLARRNVIGELIDYTERFAQMNGEPAGGDCQSLLQRAEAWFESGTALVDPQALTRDLVEYVERFAALNQEPEEGDCRRLLNSAKALLPGKASVDQGSAAQSRSVSSEGKVYLATVHLSEEVHAQALGFTRTIYPFVWGTDEDEARAHAMAYCLGAELKPERVSSCTVFTQQEIKRFTFIEQIHGLPPDLAVAGLTAQQWPEAIHVKSLSKLASNQAAMARGLALLEATGVHPDDAPSAHPRHRG